MKLLGLLTSADVKVSQERLVPYSRCYALQLNYKGHYPIPKYTDNFVIVFWGWGLGNALKTVGPIVSYFLYLGSEQLGPNTYKMW